MTMPAATVSCESCGMPLATPSDHALADPSIPYCRYCTLEDGTLQEPDERLERMTQWAMRHDGVDHAEARARSLAYMRTMPAWKDRI